MDSPPSRPLILGVSGASGLIYAVRALKFLLQSDYTVELVASRACYRVWQAERQVRMPVDLNQQSLFWRHYAQVAEAGARIVPAIPAWYHHPQTIEDLVDFVIARAFDQLNIDCVPLRRWTGEAK